VCGESRMHGDNGGDEETDREVPRLVPTHCGRGTAVRCSLVAQVAAGGGTVPAAERGVLGGRKPLDVWSAKLRHKRGIENSRLYGAMVALKLLGFATSYTVG
jgi:hypothetical protein